MRWKIQQASHEMSNQSPPFMLLQMSNQSIIIFYEVVSKATVEDFRDFTITREIQALIMRESCWKQINHWFQSSTRRAELTSEEANKDPTLEAENSRIYSRFEAVATQIWRCTSKARAAYGETANKSPPFMIDCSSHNWLARISISWLISDDLAMR
ncbi:hypothetical protein Adt_19695 [Abeliophyllum distichum]|uniref:Uncharacterized protein n=1 Tax=Abeliophyllum distichum TaxID=126358 RepID=A0ABD1SV21_9LAMI